MHFTDRTFPCRASALLAVILLAWAIPPAAAMTFSTSVLADGKHFVLAKGPIAEGDAGRLRVALQSADRDAFGHKIMALDSSGGSVFDAFAMVEIMDKERVSTIVMPGAACASACAQILFLSGIHRTVAEGGRLGLRTAFRDERMSQQVGIARLKAQQIDQWVAERAIDLGFLVTSLKGLPLGEIERTPEVRQIVELVLYQVLIGHAERREIMLFSADGQLLAEAGGVPGHKDHDRVEVLVRDAARDGKLKKAGSRSVTIGHRRSLDRDRQVGRR